jgi:hypothetical protein
MVMLRLLARLDLPATLKAMQPHRNTAPNPSNPGAPAGALPGATASNGTRP